jgi:hypothetical protein
MYGAFVQIKQGVLIGHSVIGAKGAKVFTKWDVKIETDPLEMAGESRFIGKHPEAFPMPGHHPLKDRFPDKFCGYHGAYLYTKKKLAGDPSLISEK